MRLLAVPLTALLLTPVLPVASAAADGGVRVTAVVQEADGRLSFRSERARDRAQAHRAAARLRGEPRVVAADVEHRIRVTGDPLQARQWGLTTLAAETVWAAGQADGQVVAVIDTGVDAEHPDLAGVVLPGADLVDGSTDGRIDLNGHGTHVAGVVAAVAGNGLGGAGLAQGAKVLPVRVMDADGSGYDSDAAKGLVWAADHGATVANLSLGGPDRSSVMDAAVKYALGKGVSVVVSAGNDGLNADPVMWPAANAGVIAVGAVDVNGVRPGWSSSGGHLAVAAPGAAILSTVPGGGYATWSGTSMAAPFVSAAAALMRRRAALTPGEIRSRLMSTAVDLGAVGPDAYYGAGRVDVLAATGTPVAAPEPVAPPEPAALVTTEPVSPPPAEPAPAPAPAVEPPPAPAPASVVEPAPAPAAADPVPAIVVVEPPAEPVAAAPVLSARLSASRTSTPYTSPVTVSTRTLADGAPTGGIPVRLERRVGAGWVVTRTATTASDGLASWVLRPDRTTDYRVVGDGWSSPSVRIAVMPVVSMSRLLTGRVLPGTVTSVRLQHRRATGWVTVATVSSTSYGSFRFVRRLPVGSVVRAVALGVPSPAVRR